MRSRVISRRKLLQTGTTFAVASAWAPAGNSSWARSAPAKLMRLGGPIFVDTDDPVVMAREHRRLGYRAAYAPNVSLADKERIRAVVTEFAAQDVTLAEVGAWCNMLDPDPAKRRKNLEMVSERLALAEELGARCCVNIAGSFNPDIWYGPHPDNFSQRFFDATVENVRKVIDSVKPQRTTFALEMMGWCLPTSPDEYLEFIKAIDRKAFAVHVDVCNMVNSPSRMYNNAELTRDCFEKLGPWIVSCHAKDVAWEVGMQVHFQEVIPGRGSIDYRTFLLELSKLKVDAPLMLEHLSKPEEYDEACRYIQSVARNLGLSFGAESA